MMAITGLLLTRWLSVENYAIFTVMMVLTGAIMVLTKGGVNLGLNSIMGRYWPDKYRAKQVLQVATKIRKKIAIATLPFILVFAGWLLKKNGADNLSIIILGTLLCVSFYFDFRTRLLQQVIVFANKAHKIQLVDTLLATLRLAFIFALKFAGLLNVITVVLAGIIVAGLRIKPIQKLLNKELPPENVNSLVEDANEIKQIAKRQFPLEVFFVFQGQLVFIFIAIFGSVTDTASLGAINRIGQLFLPVMAILQSYAIPRFCQLENNKILAGIFLWGMLSFFPGLILCFLAYNFPEVLLFLLGDNYSHLQDEIFIACIFFAFKSLVTLIWHLLANRGLNNFSLFQIPIFIAWCCIAPFYLDLSELSGVLYFQLGFPLALFFCVVLELSMYFKRGSKC
jgi:O-antigen/teichoic acid export membrane protein